MGVGGGEERRRGRKETTQHTRSRSLNRFGHAVQVAYLEGESLLEISSTRACGRALSYSLHCDLMVPTIPSTGFRLRARAMEVTVGATPVLAAAPLLV